MPWNCGIVPMMMLRKDVIPELREILHPQIEKSAESPPLKLEVPPADTAADSLLSPNPRAIHAAKGKEGRPSSLPVILWVEDVAGIFGFSLSEARRLITSGRVGRHFKMGRRHCVRRDAFEEALVAMELPAHPECGGLLRRRLTRRRNPTPESGTIYPTSSS